jgi:hypothetical protein
MTDTANRPDPADWIRRRLQSPIDIDDETRDLLESGFGLYDPSELAGQDGSQAASVLELLFYPNRQDRLDFEERWGEHSFSDPQIAALIQEVMHPPFKAQVRMQPGAPAVDLAVPEFVVQAFVERLNPGWQAPARLHDILRRTLQGHCLVEVRSRLRRCRFDWLESRLHFIERFLNGMAAAAEDFESCLDFVLAHLDLMEPQQAPFEFLNARKLFFFQALCRSEALERRLRESTMETLMLQGARVMSPDGARWREAMRRVDRICIALFGRTHYFERPVEEREPSGVLTGAGIEALRRGTD